MRQESPGFSRGEGVKAIRDNPEQFMPDPSRGGMPGCLGVREETCI